MDIKTGETEKMKILCLLPVVAAAVLLCGCTEPWITNTARSAVEQYLVASTIERAVENSGLMKYAGKKVFMEYTYLAPQVDKPYVQGLLELELSKVACKIVAKQEEADIMIQPLCGVLATDHSSFMIGTPTLPIPIPYMNIQFAIPEIPIFKRTKRVAFGRFAFNVFQAKDRQPIETITYIKSSAVYNNWIVLLFPFVTHDMDMHDTKETSGYSFSIL